MAQFRRGVSAITEASQRGGSSKFTPVVKFEAGETTYIQFLTAIEDVPTVLMHQFIIVGEGEREDGSTYPMYERFISRKDPSLDGPSGYDELVDRFGLQPSQRCVALAVELTPKFGAAKTAGRKTIDGFDVEERQFENRDGETVTVPAFGLVIESPFIFFSHLAAMSDQIGIDEVVWGIRRTGTGTDTTYTFIPTNVEALDLSEELEAFTESFDLEAWLEELADEDRMRELISPLPDGARVTQYPPKAKKGDKPASGRSRRPAKVEEEDLQDGADGEETSAVRSRRFTALKDKVAQK